MIGLVHPILGKTSPPVYESDPVLTVSSRNLTGDDDWLGTCCWEWCVGKGLSPVGGHSVACERGVACCYDRSRLGGGPFHDLDHFGWDYLLLSICRDVC